MLSIANACMLHALCMIAEEGTMESGMPTHMVSFSQKAYVQIV